AGSPAISARRTRPRASHQRGSCGPEGPPRHRPASEHGRHLRGTNPGQHAPKQHNGAADDPGNRVPAVDFHYRFLRTKLCVARRQHHRVQQIRPARNRRPARSVVSALDVDASEPTGDRRSRSPRRGRKGQRLIASASGLSTATSTIRNNVRMLGWPRWRPAWNTTPASSTCRLIPVKAFGFSSGGAHTPQAWRREGCQRSHPKMGLFGHDQFRDWGPRTLSLRRYQLIVYSSLMTKIVGKQRKLPDSSVCESAWQEGAFGG